jgi:two-component system cell cycle response regulator CtrA
LASARALSHAFRSAGHVSDQRDSIHAAVTAVKDRPYDCTVLISGPKAADPLKLLLRAQAGHARPGEIIVLAPVGTDFADLLRSGAAAALPSSVEHVEVVARAVSLVCRAIGAPDGVIRNGNLQVDIINRTASVCGVPATLTEREHTLVETLAMRVGHPVSQVEMLTLLYGDYQAIAPKIVDVFVCKIRKKLIERGGEGAANLIRTVWGRGYEISVGETVEV